MIKQAIETILADKDIKESILKYLKSITVEPKQEWREIYHCQSEARPRTIAESPLNGIKNEVVDYRLYMCVYYSDSGSVGRVTFFEYDARLFAPHYFRDSGYWLWEKEDEIVLISEADPFKAIDRALELWPQRKVAFENIQAVEAHV